MEGTVALDGVAQTPEGVLELVGLQVSQPRVSVVIPTYNNAASLDRLLKALRHSLVPAGGLEIIVVDDGSTDSTAGVVAAAGANYIWQHNAGTAAARDCGWRAARGDVIVFFDDDTVPEHDALSLLDQALTDADGVGAHFVALRKDSLIADYTYADGIIDHRVVDDEVRWLITGAAAFRRSALECVNGFDLNFVAAGEDVDLSIRMLQSGCRLTTERRAIVRHDHRARLVQLLETCYRYGTFSPALAAGHDVYRAERASSAFRRLSPIHLIRLYRRFRLEASRRRSLAFLVLHQMVVFPYAMGLIRSRLKADHVAAPSWRELRVRAVDEVATADELSDAALIGARRAPLDAGVERNASAV